MMHPYYIYVFDSSTANEAAIAVREGQYENIIQYHNNKHQHTADELIQGSQSLPHMMQPLSQSHSMMGGGPPPYEPSPTLHHIPPPDHMQQQPVPIEPGVPSPGPPQSMQQQLYEPSLSAQDMEEHKFEINGTTEDDDESIINSTLLKDNLRPSNRQVARQDYIDMRSCGNLSQEWLDTICRHMIEHMNSFGICVIDNFLGSIKGEIILREVKQLFSNRSYTTGRLVNDKLDKTSSDAAIGQTRENKSQTKPTMVDPAKTIRNDRVIWVDGDEDGCEEINNLIQTLCSVITNSSRLSLYSNNGLDKVVINKRTKAHVACYPGNGTRYIKHVDNPNGDGRVITAIYYLNKSWNTKRDGGLLRMFPTGVDTVANIEPLFDRVLFFWSDRRNPHEVLPAYRDRFAITVWYIGESRAQET